MESATPVAYVEILNRSAQPEHHAVLACCAAEPFELHRETRGTEQIYAGTGNQRYSLGHRPPGAEIEAWGVNEGIHLLLVLVSEKDWQVRYECLETGCEARLTKVVPEIPQDAWTAFFPTYIGAVEGAGISEVD